MKTVKLSRLFIFVLVIFSSFAFSACSKEGEKAAGGSPPAVSVAEVLVREIIPWEEFTGRIEAKEAVNIRPRVGGVIQSVAYREGDLVSADDLLFVLDPEPFRTELKRAKAELSRIRAQATLAQLESRRARNLVKRKLLSQDEYDRRVATENQANANVRAAEAATELARLSLSYTEVRSPINGRSGRALMTKGNLVSSEPTPDLLTTVFSLDPVYVVFDSDEMTYLNFFANSPVSNEQAEAHQRTVFVGLGNEEGYPRKGYVDFVDNQIASGSGTIRVRAVLDNKEHGLTPGLFARVKLLANKSTPVILIDEQAILTDQDRKYVYVLGEGNTAMRRDIKTGRSAEGFRIITDGLNAGDRIIVHGIQKVFFPNMPVTPQTISMGDPSSPAGPKRDAPH